MFNNIGNKFKILAKIYFWVLTIGSIGTSLIMLMIDGDLFLFIGLPCLAGPLVAWISSWFIYVIGEIVDILYGIYLVSACAIKTKSGDIIEPESLSDDERLKRLHSLKMFNLITQEEYQTKRAEIINNL